VRVEVDESRDWTWSHGRSVALSVALKEAADRLVTSPTLAPRVKQALVNFTNNDRVSQPQPTTTTAITTTMTITTTTMTTTTTITTMITTTTMAMTTTATTTTTTMITTTTTTTTTTTIQL